MLLCPVQFCCVFGFCVLLFFNAPCSIPIAIDAAAVTAIVLLIATVTVTDEA